MPTFKWFLHTSQHVTKRFQTNSGPWTSTLGLSCPVIQAILHPNQESSAPHPIPTNSLPLGQGFE